MITQANSLNIPLADKSIHCAVTSPPYWGLRSYLPSGDPLKPLEIGLEETLQEYVAKMVMVFREVWRVLRDDGTLWLNVGDSYCTSPAGNKTCGNGVGANKHYQNDSIHQINKKNFAGLKPKDLAMIPARLALALQDDGWYLRSDIIWHKTNPMPESVTDRPTTSHEHVFLLAKQERYFYDAEAVREPVAESTIGRGPVDFGGDKGRRYKPDKSDPNFRNGKEQWGRTYDYTESSARGRNLRSVWSIATESYAGAHYATFPTKLVEPCIKAGTSQRGVCPVCGAPWVRVVERKFRPMTDRRSEKLSRASGKKGVDDSRCDAGTPRGYTDTETIGWQPTCSCNADPIPAIVLDPFCGSGTTGEVARYLGRRFVGLDLNPTYLALNALPRAEQKTSAAALAELPMFRVLT